VPSLRLSHFTPLRYPGGKGKLAKFVKEVIEENRLSDGLYIEPYAGGAAVALELLFHGYVENIHINDLSQPIYTFWVSVLEHTDDFCRLIMDTALNVETWDKQKAIFGRQDASDKLSLGFATFYLNRTNRSGILNGGIIGGRDQRGSWGIDARFNRRDLIYRVSEIAKLRQRRRLSSLDALQLLRYGASLWPEKSLLYLDPPYYVKGRDLYYDYYSHDDHAAVADHVKTAMGNLNWMISYDDVPEIRTLYSGYKRYVYKIRYSARQSTPSGNEVMFFSDKLQAPKLIGPVHEVEAP
jgi:DNA adenine methylase